MTIELFRETIQFLMNGERPHHYCDDDCWYTCPKHPEGCCNESAGTECNCGADEYNAKLTQLLVKLEKEL